MMCKNKLLFFQKFCFPSSILCYQFADENFNVFYIIKETERTINETENKVENMKIFYLCSQE